MHPTLPAVVMLVSFAVFMAALVPLDFSSLINEFFPSHPKPLTNPNAVVWINKAAGTYFCADSLMFGQDNGKYMKQALALDSGYQPALGAFCEGPNWPIPAQRNRTSESKTSADSLKAPPEE